MVDPITGIDDGAGPPGGSSPDWFADNAPPGAAQSGPNYGGAYATIAAWFKKYTGKDPSDADVRQWGTNLDANYLAKIENAIKTLGANSGYWDLASNAPKAAPQPAPSSGSKKSISQIFQEVTGGLDPTSQNLDKLIEALKANGYDATRATHAGNQPSDDKLVINGHTYDFIKDVGGPGAGWQFPGEDGDTGGGPPDLLSPFPDQFNYPGFTPPPDFKAPTADQAFNDQGFQFTLKQGRDALEKSAAANGTLLTTGTLQDLDSFSQGLASNQYDKVYNRDLGEYESKYGHAQTNYDRDRGNALQQYGLKHDLWNEAQDRPYSKLYGLAQLGQGMPGGANYAAGMSNTLTGIGNAQGAAGLYGANAWQGAFGSLANLGGYYAGSYRNSNSYGRRPPWDWAGY